MDTISVVVPCYNEQESLPVFLDELERVALGLAREHGAALDVVLVDDGSTDATLATMRARAGRGRAMRVRWVSLSRNFGKEAALACGLARAGGDMVATMDADMQDPPRLLPEMYGILRAGEVDCVAARRATRSGEPAIRSLLARAFYRLIGRISHADIADGARDFRLMRRAMVDAVLSLPERNRFSKGIFGWVGFKTRWLPYVNERRVAGETKWGIWSLALYSLDGIVAFSTAPLSIASVAGVLLCLAALVGAAAIVAKTLAWGDPVGGWPSLACIVALLGGVQLLCLGIVGQYLAKTYLETKGRPLYIVRESDEDEL